MTSDRDLHSLAPDHGNTWVLPLDSQETAVSTISVLDDKGRVWCTARLTT